VPSDSTVIIAALGGALVTASVGAGALLRTHAQRLRHERDLAYTAELRRVLDAGADLAVRANAITYDIWAKGCRSPEAEALEQEMIAYEQRLMFWVDFDDDVVQLWHFFTAAFSRIQAGSDPEAEFSGRQIGGWQAEWMAAGRARVGPGGVARTGWLTAAARKVRVGVRESARKVRARLGLGSGKRGR
jgi:hypothetical protein